MKRKPKTIEELEALIEIEMAKIAEIEEEIQRLEMKIVDCILDMYNDGIITLEEIPIKIKEKIG